MIRSLTLLIFLLPFLSCRNDLGLVMPEETVPVIYGLISPQDTVHRVRITRTFSGEGSALQMAQNCDSLYFPDAEVFLELRNPDGRVIERRQLRKTIQPDREEGLFCHSPNYAWECPALPVVDSDSTRPAQYALTISFPDRENYCYAETVVPPKPRLEFPELLKRNPEVDLFLNNIITIRLPDDYYTEFRALIHFSELSYGTWQSKHLLYERRYPAAIRTSHNRFDYFDLSEDWFITQIVLSIRHDTLIQARRFKGIELRFTHATKPFNDYYYSVRSGSDLQATGYSNIINGYGLFGSFNTRFYPGYLLNPRSMDSLVNGICTRPLRFIY